MFIKSLILFDIAWFDSAFYLKKNVYEHFACIYVCTPLVCLVFTEAGTEHQIPLELEFHTVGSLQGCWDLDLGPQEEQLGS